VDDFAAITPTAANKFAGALTVLSGIFSTILSLQALSLEVRGPYVVSIPLFGALGVGGVFAGVGLLRLRGPATVASAGIAFATSFAALVWFVVTLLHGLLVLLPLLLTPLSGSAGIFAMTCLKQAKLADEARSRLRAEGLDSGL
jgi:hypothetical protein